MRAENRYSAGAVALHWLLALLLAGEIALGFAMPRDASGFAQYQLHKSIGITILALSLLRLAWRFTHTRPALSESGFTGFLAAAVHAGFYVFMIAMPLTGWALVSSDPVDVPTVVFGLLELPHLPVGDQWNGLAEDAHEWLAYGGLALFALHVLGALRHHVLMADDLLARMTFDGKSSRAFAAGGMVIAVGLITLFTAGQDRAADVTQSSETAAPPLAAQPVPLPTEPIEPNEDTTEADAPQEDEGAQDEAEVAQEPAVPAETAAPPPNWTIEPGAILRFRVDNAGNAIIGSFANWSGDIAMDPDNPQTAQIAIRINLASASLGDVTQDTMLQGGDFFASEQFSQAVWRSTAVRRIAGNRYEADGTLSLKGVSRPQRITFTLAGSGNRRSVTGSAVVDRTVFGVGTGSSAANLGTSVTVDFAFDATS